MVDWYVILCNLGKTKTNFANYFPSERSEEEGEREESRPRVRIFLNSVFREYLMILFPENISQFCFWRIFL